MYAVTVTARAMWSAKKMPRRHKKVNTNAVDFEAEPTRPDGRQPRPAYEIWHYIGDDTWTLQRGAEIVGEVYREGGAWKAARQTDTTPRKGFLTFAMAQEYVED